jgi:glycosyltransferase involved in cell wall biosynthesis
MCNGAVDLTGDSMSTRSNDGVSICIPNWNHRKYIGRSVGSALRAAQLLKAKGLGAEVLIVDDFSRDGSQRILFSAALRDDTEMLNLIVASDNAGLGATRNLALSRAKYNIVCFMDADNELIPGNMYHFWRSIIETNATLVYGNLITSNGYRTTGLLSNDFVGRAIYNENYIDAFCLVNAKRVESVGGYYMRHTTAHEDWELLLHLIAENQEIVFVPMALGKYYVVDLSMIQTEKFDHSRIHRIFNQRKTGFPNNFRPRRIYHPDLGWL